VEVNENGRDRIQGAKVAHIYMFSAGLVTFSVGEELRVIWS